MSDTPVINAGMEVLIRSVEALNDLDEKQRARIVVLERELAELRAIVKNGEEYELGYRDGVSEIYDGINSAPAESTPGLCSEWQTVVEQFGRTVTDMFEQMERGNWKDDHDHDVRMNAAMIALKSPVAEAIRLRAIDAARGETK